MIEWRQVAFWVIRTQSLKRNEKNSVERRNSKEKRENSVRRRMIIISRIICNSSLLNDDKYQKAKISLGTNRFQKVYEISLRRRIISLSWFFSHLPLEETLMNVQYVLLIRILPQQQKWQPRIDAAFHRNQSISFNQTHPLVFYIKIGTNLWA
jgi:hypothetical protein